MNLIELSRALHQLCLGGMVPLLIIDDLGMRKLPLTAAGIRAWSHQRNCA